MKPDPLLPAPYARLLSNGSYFVFVTAAGTGQSRRHGHVVNRWHGDAVEEAQGQFIYLRDLDNGILWSAAMQPLMGKFTAYQSSAEPGVFHIASEAHGIRAQLDVAVSPSEELEVRRLQLINLTQHK